MNENHARLCPTPEWAKYLQTDVLPVVTRDVDLGAAMLEIGPGPGAATDWLRHKVEQLTVVEIDEAAAGLLTERYSGTNVAVRTGSGADLDYPDALSTQWARSRCCIMYRLSPCRTRFLPRPSGC